MIIDLNLIATLYSESKPKFSQNKPLMRRDFETANLFNILGCGTLFNLTISLLYQG